MFRFSKLHLLSRSATRRMAVAAVLRCNCSASAAFSSAASPLSSAKLFQSLKPLKNPYTFITPERKGPEGTVREENGQRVYSSWYNSVLPELTAAKSYYHYIMDAVRSAPADRVALVQYDTREELRYGEVPGMVESMSNYLFHTLKLRKGDVLCLLMANHYLYPVLMLAASRVGVVLTTSGPLNTPSALASQLEACGCQAILCEETAKDLATASVAELQTTVKQQVPVYTLETMLQRMGEAAEIPSDYTAEDEISMDDVLVIPFSSGTTGTPKGVQVTQRGLLANFLQVNTATPLWRKDTGDSGTFLQVSVQYHISGFSNSTFCMAARMTQVVLRKYTADNFLGALEDYGVTHSQVAPALVSSLVGRLEECSRKGEDSFDTSSLMYLMVGSSPISTSMSSRFLKLMPQVRFCEVYGMTEMSPCVTLYPYIAEYNEYVFGSMILPDSELRMVRVDNTQQSGEDASAGIDALPGGEGEVWVRGPQMMKGYLNDADNKVALVDGWYRTGDIGHYDEEKGLLLITDRLKELIKYKGFQVSPTSLEGEILKHPWVQDCIVVGVPDWRDAAFENPRALVVLRAGVTAAEAAEAPEAIRRFIEERNPPHKRLHGGVRVVQELMRSHTNKLMRRQQRDAEIQIVKDELTKLNRD